MAPLLARAVKEGHQLGNHMSEDRSYYQWDKDCFERELDYTEAVLAEFDSIYHLQEKSILPHCTKILP